MIGESLSILWYYAAAKSGPRPASRERLESWQDRRVRAHLAWVVRNSPFYRERYAGADLSRWRDLPTIDKASMMAHFDTLNTRGISSVDAFATALKAEESRDFSPKLRDVTVGLSSGTSGSRGLFLVSDSERRRWAGYTLAAMLPGSILAPHRIAFFLRADSNLYRSVGSGRIRFEFFDLMTPPEDNLARLEGLAPDVVVGPPSMLRLIARARLDGALAITPRKVISVAEVLDPFDELVIAEAFGAPVHQAYQCTEGFLGRTCAHGTLHLNEDVVVVQKEWLDRELRKFSPIITDFRRRTQPIIRYRLNDVLTERAEPCPCGSVMTALEQVEGRCDDVFSLRTSNGAEVLVFPDFIRRAVITADAEIVDYRVVQDAPGNITVHLGPLTAESEEAVCRSLDVLFDRLGAEPPSVVFREYAHAVGPKKLRRVERNLRAPSEEGAQ